MIKQTNLNHEGGLYLYTVSQRKLDRLAKDSSSLRFYLHDMFNNCPNSYFNGGPRSSNIKIKYPFSVHQINGHEISDLAKQGLKLNSERFKSNHSKVQMFMLEHDNKTIAAEVPIWLEKQELPDFSSWFNSSQPLTGHIDLVRIEDEKIWIWDYKPNAIKERYASTQIFLYSLMLSRRIGTDLEKFRCGYFDSDHAFIFKPDIRAINKNVLITDYI